MERRVSDRQRKTAEQYNVKEEAEVSAPLVVPEGKGSKLGDLPQVFASFKKRKVEDAAVTSLHRLIYGRPGVKHLRKQYLGKFYGFPKDQVQCVLLGGRSEEET